MNLHIRKVGPDEVEPLHEILRQCGQDMKTRLGLGHWDPPYPLHLFRKSAEERDVYAVLDGDQPVATFTIGTDEPSYYRTIPALWESWDASGEPALYLNKLAVLPELQGQGIGTRCMQTIEQIALARGCEAVRFDAYEKHQQPLKFYDKLNYHKRGAFIFTTKQYGETGMVCFEKLKYEFFAEESYNAH